MKQLIRIAVTLSILLLIIRIAMPRILHGIEKLCANVTRAVESSATASLINITYRNASTHTGPTTPADIVITVITSYAVYLVLLFLLALFLVLVRELVSAM